MDVIFEWIIFIYQFNSDAIDQKAFKHIHQPFLSVDSMKFCKC